MGFQGFLRLLIPREDQFYDFLEQQALLAHEGALAMAKLTQERASSEAVRDAVQAVEHRGDSVVHQMEEALARTFVTPLDREDLKKLSDELDDVLDLTNGAARIRVLTGIESPSDASLKLIGHLVDGTRILATAMPLLRKHAYNDLVTASRELRRVEKASDQVYREAIRQLFADPAVDAKSLLREKEMLDDLERAIDRCEEAGETLANLAIKHG